MEVFFLRMVCSLAMLIGFGSWGIGKLLKQNPKVKRAATNGVVSLIARLFGV